MAFDEPTVVVLKHASPCGIASAPKIVDAVGPAIASDPVSAFGSVIASNREIKLDFIKSLGDLFVECIAAPGFSQAALETIKARGNLRALEIPLQNRLKRTKSAPSKGGSCGRTSTEATQKRGGLAG